MKHPPTTPALASIAACTLLTHDASAQVAGQGDTPPGTRALIIDDTLNATLGLWRGVENGAIIATAPDGGALRTEGLPIAAIPVNGEIDPTLGVGATMPRHNTPPDQAARWERLLTEGPPGLLTLTDGQRVAGQPEAAPSADRESADAELAWTVWSLGVKPVSVPLERIATAAFDASPAVLGRLDAAPPDRDTVLLANGDEVSGFVASLAGPALVETMDAELTFDLGVVAGVALANPTAPPTGPRLWLDDGSVIGVRAARALAEGSGLRIEAEILGSAGASDMGVVPRRAVLGVAAAGRLAPLADLRPDAQRSPDDAVVPRRLETAAHPDDHAPTGATPVGLRDLVLPGPMSVSWTVPEGAARFAATAALDGPAGRWGDCTLTVTLDGETAREIDLARNGVTAAPINIEVIPGATLDITLSEGAFGAVGDRVALRRPMFLLEPDPPLDDAE